MRRLGGVLFSLAATLIASIALSVPQRIVSTALTADEILLALIGDTQRLRAVSALARNKLHSNIYQAPHLPPSLQATSVEHVVTTRPDLIVYSVFNRPEFISLAQHLGIDTLVLKKATKLEHIFTNIMTLGIRVGAQPRAQALVNKLRRLLTNTVIRRGKAPPQVLNFFADNTLMGKGTIFDALIAQAGGINLAAQHGIKGFRVISAEILASLQPDFIVIPTGIYQPQAITARLSKAVGWRNMRAIQQRKFIFIPNRELMATSQYAFTALTKMHKALAEFKHP